MWRSKAAARTMAPSDVRNTSNQTATISSPAEQPSRTGGSSGKNRPTSSVAPVIGDSNAQGVGTKHDLEHILQHNRHAEGQK
jgi:hypothetical protein